MILNVWTITSLFLAAVGGLLALATLAIAVAGLRTRRVADGVALEAAVDRGHLLVLVITVLAGVRFLAWPHFYGLLRSYVPDLAPYGVMCVFGVTRIEPALVGVLQWAKPTLLVVVGLWLLVLAAERRVGSPVFLRLRHGLAIPIALLVLAECSAEIVYALREKVGRPVTCCTTFRDTEAASIAENVSPLATWSDAPPSIAIGLLLVLGGVIVLLATTAARSRSAGVHPALALLLALLGVANLLVTQWVWIDAVAPRVLGLPYHHCIYELITDTPAFGLAAFLTILGSAGLWWPPALALLRGRAPDAITAVQRSVYRVSAVAVATALLIVVVHVV